MDIEIRYTQPRDAVSIEELLEAYDMEPADSNDNFNFGWEIETIEKDAVEYYQTSWVGAFDGDKLIGICWIGESENEYGRNDKLAVILSDVYVLPNRRRNGVGTALVNKALSFAKEELGERDVIITLLDDDLVPFYERFNFVFETAGIGHLYC